jgi:sialidase-1
MEGIVRHAKISNPAMDIVMMHFVDPQKMEIYRNGGVPEVIKNHNAVAEHYGISTLNLAKEVTDRIDHEEFSWLEDFKNLHPSPFGQGIYAQSMIEYLDNAYSEHLDNDDKIIARPLPDKLNIASYDKGELIDISFAKKLKGWHIQSAWAPKDGTGTRSNYTNVPMLISEQPGSSLQFKFSGNAVGIAVAAGQDAGNIEYRVDSSEWKKLILFTQWSKHLHLPWYYTLASGLKSGKHILKIRISDDKSEQSSGNACRIRYFFINNS